MKYSSLLFIAAHIKFALKMQLSTLHRKGINNERTATLVILNLCTLNLFYTSPWARDVKVYEILTP